MPEDKEPRRRFLRQVLTLVPTTSIASTAIIQTGCSNSATSEGAASADVYAPTYFSPDEWSFVRAATDRLIPADEHGPGALEAGVPGFIDRQMETPFGHGKLWYMQGPFHTDEVPELGYQLSLVPRDIYRHGIAGCDAWCRRQYGKSFAELETSVQQHVLTALQGGKVPIDAVPSATFFKMLLANTREGFFSDPIHGGNRNMIGWKMVGFPGARADFMDWIDQPNVKYPYGPVSISGKRG